MTADAEVERVTAEPTQSTSRPSFRTFTVMVRGEELAVTTVGGLAVALGRCSESIRRMERLGILPPAPIRSCRRSGQRLRLYPQRYVDDMAEIAQELGLHQRRLRAAEPELTARSYAARDASRVTGHG